MTELIGTMGTKAMKPDGAVRAHDHHTVNNNGTDKPPGKIMKQETEKERKHANYHQ